MFVENPKALETLLKFYTDSGVDYVLCDHPQNRLEHNLEKRPLQESTTGAYAVPFCARPAQSLHNAPPASGPYGPPFAEIPPFTQEFFSSSEAIPLPLERGRLSQDVSPWQPLPAQEKNAPQLAGAQKTPKPSLKLPSLEETYNAESLAKKAQNLEDLKAYLENFDGCALKYTAKNTCFSDGRAGSALMIIGEAPGAEEDRQGVPFVGRAGQLLNKMLEAIGLTREDVYITNTIPWRPPGNRTPTSREVEICRPFLERHIVLAEPKILLALGSVAAKALLYNDKLSILRTRGSWYSYQTKAAEMQLPSPVPLMTSLHPAYLLRAPAQKRLAWEDFLQVKKKLSATNAQHLINL